MHALEPGHGKSFIASYMLGEKIKVRGLLSMLGTLLVSHFLLLTVLAVLVKYLFDGISQEYLLSIQEWAAPAIIFVFGGYLFWRSWRTRHLTEEDCSCGLHDHSHAHDHALDHDHTHAHHHDHAHDHGHHHRHKKKRNPALVGMITGLIPCPSALAPVFLSATASFDNVLYLSLIHI